MLEKDSRIVVMNEVLSGMKVSQWCTAKICSHTFLMPDACVE